MTTKEMKLLLLFIRFKEVGFKTVNVFIQHKPGFVKIVMKFQVVMALLTIF